MCRMRSTLDVQDARPSEAPDVQDAKQVSGPSEAFDVQEASFGLRVQGVGFRRFRV